MWFPIHLCGHCLCGWWKTSPLHDDDEILDVLLLLSLF
jgi:hypothetical protein